MGFFAEVSTADVREAWHKICVERTGIGQPAVDALADSFAWGESFYGDSIEGMTDKLDNGYVPEGQFSGSTAGGESQVVPEMIWDEDEGTMDIVEVLQGADLYRYQWEDVPAPRGVTIRAQVNMLGAVSADVIAQYQDFVQRAIIAAKGLGGAPAVTLMHRVEDTFDRSGLLEMEIPLVAEGETVDPVSWQAFFSPGGFRMLGFIARGVAANKLGQRVRGGFGRSAGRGWKVTREGDVITITCPPSAGRFPREDMEAQLDAAFNA